ncbi:MAG TPA: histidine phosphatase family protein [Pyrinomonadaceae bacterium]
MSNVYFIRHGQAGTRGAYDSLSGLGRRQARLLGEYLAGQGVEFAAAYAGGLVRQQQTCAAVAAAYAEAGLAFPEVAVDAGWDEFDFHHVYKELAPLMCEDDEEFRREHEEVAEQLRASADDHAADVHRVWRASDTKVMDAWIGGRYPYAGESWGQFIARVAACRPGAVGSGRRPRENVAVFTSAMPTAVWTARALGAPDGHIPRLAAVLLNTSYTVLQLRADETLLLTFNAVPHLHSPELRTRR